MKKLVTSLAAASLGLALLTACSSQSKTNSSTEQKETATAQSSTVEKTNDKVQTARKNYDSIQIGDLMQSGEGGTTKEDAVKLFGEPNSTTQMDLNDKKVEQLTWTIKTGVVVTVQFMDNHATTKAITGFTFNREAKIGLNEFNSLPEEASYADAVNLFGEPDTTSESMISGQRTNLAVWMSGVKGNPGANISIMFTNDKATTKTQTNLTD